MDKPSVIDHVVIALNGLTVSGVSNMQIIIESIQALAALKAELEKEAGSHANDHNQQE